MQKQIPDLAIEVIFFSFYRLRIDNNDNYEAIACSEILELAGLDIDLLTRCVAIAQTSRLEAANILRKGINK